MKKRSIRVIAMCIIIATIAMSLSSCAFGELLESILNNSHEHSWDNWVFDYTDDNVNVVCTVCDKTISSVIFSRGLEIKDGVLLSIGDCTDTEVVVPNGVEVIGDDAFRNCESLKAVYLPNSVRVIGERAFMSCGSLEFINIPEGTLEIGKNAFQHCINLTGVLFPESICNLGNDIFFNSPKLTTIYYNGDENGWNTITFSTNWLGDNTIANILFKKIGANCNHVFNSQEILKEGACYTPGIYINNCSLCGRGVKASLSYKCTIQDDAEWIIDYEPTCYSDGYRYRSCLCGDQTEGEYFSSGHNTEITVTDGVVSVFCYDCDKVVFSCDYVEGSSGLNIVKGRVLDTGLCTDKTIVIPSYFDGYIVTELAKSAIQTDAVESVVIPEGVRIIGEYCFSGANNLISIEIPSSVEKIGGGAFPESLTCYSEYGNGLYLGNSNNPYLVLANFEDIHTVTDVTIHKDTKIIHDRLSRNLLGDSPELYNISVDKGNLYFKSINGNLYSKDGKTLIRYTPGKTEESFAVPNGVTSIVDHAFKYANNLKSLITGETVTFIGISAFENCSNLTDVKLPETIKVISERMFYGCNGLKNLTIPEGVERVDEWAFASCPNLERISLPSTLNIIGPEILQVNGFLPDKVIEFRGTQAQWYSMKKSFVWNWNCGDYVIEYADKKDIELPTEAAGLEYTLNDEGTGYIVSGMGSCTESDLVIPDNYLGVPVVAIGYAAFYGQVGLKSVTIPGTVTDIGYFAFYNCTDLTSVVFLDGITNTGPYSFSGCTSLTNVILPDSVTSIEEHTFRGCTSLTSITIPNSVTSIGDFAFSECSYLTHVYYTGSEEEWMNISFGYANNILKLIVIEFNVVPNN